MFARVSRLLLLCAALPLALASCDELLGEDFGTITYPLEYEIPVNFPIAYPPLATLQQLQNDGEDRYPIQFYVPVDLSGQTSWLTGSNVVDEVRIVGVTMEIAENTMTTPIEPVEFRVGDGSGQEFTVPGTRNDSFEGALQVAVTPLIELQAPPFTGTQAAEIVSANTTAAATRIAELDFGVGLGTELVIPAGELPEGGRANARFTLELQFVINPIN